MMNVIMLLRGYRWRVRECETLRRQLDELTSPWYDRPDPRGRRKFNESRDRRQRACEAGLLAQEDRLRGEVEAVETVIAGIAHPRTRLVMRQYYALGMSDRQIAAADGFSERTAWNIRHRWLREHEERAGKEARA